MTKTQRQATRREIDGEIEDHEVWGWIFEIDDRPHGRDCPYCWPDGPPLGCGTGWKLEQG